MGESRLRLEYCSRDERLSRATRAHRLLLKASTSSTGVLFARAGWRLYKKTTEDSQTIHGLVTIEAPVLLT